MRRALVILLFASLVPDAASAQVFVEPERAFRTQVRHFDYAWRYIDILTEPTDEGEKGGVRLYFYERERQIAEIAASLLHNSYDYLTERFGMRPPQRFPYILYNTYQEFLETNLFPMQEGVLGVTSPQDLTLTLPYLGDHQLFNEVSTHELAHQFTIQKLRVIGERMDTNGEELIGSLPLWFVEGLAEFYAHDGITPDADMIAHDMVLNPDVEMGFGPMDFFEDRIYSVLWIYKMGQVRVAFLEETYGEGFTQRLLDATPRLVGPIEDDDGNVLEEAVDFRGLVGVIAGEAPERISSRFEAWMKDRAYRGYLDAKQTAPTIDEIPGWNDDMQTMSSSPNGQLLLYRAIDFDTGTSSLELMDWRTLHSKVRVAEDGVPGIVSLHPTFGKSFDVTNDQLTFVAQTDGHDMIYVQQFKHESQEVALKPQRGTPRPGEPVQKPDAWLVDIDLGTRRGYDLSGHNILAATAPAFSPDGKRVAFIGTDASGVRDLYVLTPGEDSYELQKITDDIWSERNVAWGADGIVFTSNATTHGHYNLFLVDPAHKEDVRQLTSESRDHADPVVLPSGRVLFTAFDQGRSDVYEVTADGVLRRTSVATGLFEIGPGPDGGIWASYYRGGERVPVQVRYDDLLKIAEAGTEPPRGPFELPHQKLDAAQAYDATDPKNWRLGTIFGVLGAGGGSIFGRVIASANDELRNHALVLDVAIFGRPELTDGMLLYLNQEHRLTVGAGLFQGLSLRFDTTFEELPRTFLIGERFWGAMATVRYPFNTFQYVEADVAAGGVNHFVDAPTRAYLQSGELNGTGRDLLDEWRDANRGIRPQGEIRLRIGHDTIRYHRMTGPLDGTSVLLQGSLTSQPTANQLFGEGRLDVAKYLAIAGSANIYVRGGVGTSLGGDLARQYYLSSWDTIRGVPPGDPFFLIGRQFFYSTMELQFPLNTVVRVVFLPAIEGVVGFDFGGVGNDPQRVWDKRVLDYVMGVNFVLSPLVFRLHWAHNIDTGARPTFGEDHVVHTPPHGWVLNLSLGWLYL